MASLGGGRKLRRWAAGVALVLLAWLAVVAPARADGVVRGFYFYSPDCVYCRVVAAEVLPVVRERYGARLELRSFDIRVPRNYQLLLDLERRYGVTQVGLPEVFIGSTVLIGEKGLRESLVPTIERYLAAGGVNFPTQDLPAEPAAPQPAAANAPAVHVAYFYRAGCAACDRAAHDLGLLQSRYPGLRVAAFDIAERAALNEALAAKFGLPETMRLVTPAVFVGQDALAGAEVTLSRLEELIDRYAEAGAPATWEGLEAEPASAGVIERFRSFGLLTVVGAGLIDGLNPCAFATLVFFVSYLAFLGRSRREVIMVGAAFTAGVFATYLLVGLGFLRFAKALSGVYAVGRVVYGAMAVLCFAFAGFSLHDAWLARRGRPESMKLRLPRSLQKRVHQVIREHSSRRASVGVAALTGAVVSFLELACTGQVYLPTILFVLGVPHLRLHAVSYLVLYNLAFVTPLIVVFVVAALGTSSSRLALLVQKHTSTVKLLTAGVFVVLGAWLAGVVL